MKKNYRIKNFLILFFVSILLTPLAVSINEVFAMGQAPSTCYNRYDGTITSMKITVGHKTYDPILNPGVTFQLRNDKSYTVTVTIHMPTQSSQNNTLEGTSWYSTSAPGYYLGQCISGAAPNKDIVIISTEAHPANLTPQTTQNVTWKTLSSNEVTYNIKWVNP